MDVSTYNRKRTRLIELYRELEYHSIPMLVRPSSFMTNKEIENRETNIKDDITNVQGGIHSLEIYQIKVKELLTLIRRNEGGIGTFGFESADDCVRLYQVISEYIELWMDIANEVWDVPIPPVKELYALEEVALWVYHSYSEIFLFRINKKLREQRMYRPKEVESVFLTLANLGVNPNGDLRPQDVRFTSTLDDRLPDRFRIRNKAALNAKSTDDVAWEIEFSKIASLIE